MRLALGLILVILGLVGAYFVLTGRFPPTQVTSAETSNMPGSSGVTGGGKSAAGTGGVSIQSRLTHIGIPTHIAHRGDVRASRGGYNRA